MSATATEPRPAENRSAPEAPRPKRPLWRVGLDFFSSLKLTVWLLALGILVVFFGTLAQTEDGLYVAQEKYFRSLFAVWSPHDPALQWLKIPLPGGYLLGTLLLANLIVAHFMRFKMSWKKSGIFLTHLGVILLLIGQLTTDMFAIESRMSFAEGEWRNYTEDFHKTELAFLTDAAEANMDDVVAIPESLLSTGAEVRHGKLPFTIRVKQYAENANVRRHAPMVDTNTPVAASQGSGARMVMEPLAPTRAMDTRNFPAVITELIDASGRPLGTWLFSMELFDQEIVHEGKTYRVGLRPLRYYHHFSLKLLKTTHEVYPGTDTPRNFQSRVLLENPRNDERREVDIYMNNPLRYAGLTFFQHQMGRDQVDRSRGTSVFQVVRNPSWLTPYAGTIIVGIGLLVQFMIHLVGFVRKRTA